MKNLASVIVAASELIRFFQGWSLSLLGTLSGGSSAGVIGLPDRMRWASDKMGESRACRCTSVSSTTGSSSILYPRIADPNTGGSC